MRRVFLKVYSGSLFFSIANSIEALVPFILAPLLTRMLEPHSYGIWDLFIIFVSFLRPIVSLTIQDSLKMRYYDLEPEARTRYLSAAFTLTTLNTILILLACLTFSGYLGAALKFPQEWIAAIIITAFLFGLFYSLLTFNQFSHDRKSFIGLHIIQSGLSISVIAALLMAGLGWQGVIIGKMTALAIAIVVGIVWLTPNLDKKLFFNPDFRYYRELIRFGIFYLPAGIGIVAVGLIDRLIIGQVYDVAMIGQYGVATLFGKVLSIVTNGFILAWMPWLFQNLKDNTLFKKQIVFVSLSFLFLMPVLGLILYGASLFLAPILIGGKFQQAFTFIPWAIAAVVLEAYFFHNQAFLHFRKKVLLMSVASIMAVSLNVILTLAMIVPYGIIGVFAATCIAYIITIIFTSLTILLIYRQIPYKT